MHACKWPRWAAVWLSVPALLVLSACYIPHPRYGADNFWQDKNVKGLYWASGKVGYEKPEVIVGRVMQAACPTGHPVLLSGNEVIIKAESTEGVPITKDGWTAAFTCNDPIPLD